MPPARKPQLPRPLTQLQILNRMYNLKSRTINLSVLELVYVTLFEGQFDHFLIVLVVRDFVFRNGQLREYHHLPLQQYKCNFNRENVSSGMRE